MHRKFLTKGFRMNEDQIEYVKKEIVRKCLHPLSHPGHGPKVVELIKPSSLADVQRRYRAGEPW